METKITKTVLTHIEEVKFGYWNDDTEEFIPIHIKNIKDNLDNQLNVSPELLFALHATFDLLIDAINADLRDIWEKLEENS